MCIQLIAINIVSLFINLHVFLGDLIDRGYYMSGHVIRDLLHDLFEKAKNKALPILIFLK